MKIVSYNINTCTQKKLDELFKMNADVFVVPEIAREDKIKLPDGFDKTLYQFLMLTRYQFAKLQVQYLFFFLSA